MSSIRVYEYFHGFINYAFVISFACKTDLVPGATPGRGERQPLGHCCGPECYSFVLKKKVKKILNRCNMKK